MTDRGRGRPRAASREGIRAIAIELFIRNGYSKTSLEQIAAAAGISRTTLFAYFPAKRDLIWAELIERAASDAGIGESDDRPLVDLIVERMLDLGRYPAADRIGMATRWRLVQQNDELRAFGAIQAAELARQVSAEVLRRASSVDPQLVDHVVQALIAVTTQCAEEWAQGAGADEDLDAYTSRQIAPIAGALRPLLA